MQLSLQRCSVRTLSLTCRLLQRTTSLGELTVSSVLQQERLTLLNVLRRTTSMQSMIQFMRWLVTRLDTEEPLRDFLTDILANYKIDKYHLKMQRKNQFVKMSFYELVLFWSSSANLKLSVCFIFFITFIGSPSRDNGCHRS